MTKRLKMNLSKGVCVCVMVCGVGWGAEVRALNQRAHDGKSVQGARQIALPPFQTPFQQQRYSSIDAI